jgi:hypothetical protein
MAHVRHMCKFAAGHETAVASAGEPSRGFTRGSPTTSSSGAQAVGAPPLSHPNIIPIHAVEDTGGFVSYVMAFKALSRTR